MAPVLKSKPVPRPIPIHRQASGRGQVRVGVSTADALDHPETIVDWDDEELFRGKRRDKNGSFTGRDPLVVPLECFRELTRRQMRKAQMNLSRNVNDAVDTLVNIAKDPRADDKARVAAAKLVLDRVLGTAPIKVEGTGNQPLFIGLIQGGIVSGSLTINDPSIIDAESTEVDWGGN